MTLERIMKLAELSEDKSEKLYGHNPMSSMAEGTWMPQGALAENRRILPLIKALAESNSELVEALKECGYFCQDQIARTNTAIETDCSNEGCDYQCSGCIRSIDDCESTKGLIGKALTAHEARMKKLEMK